MICNVAIKCGGGEIPNGHTSAFTIHTLRRKFYPLPLDVVMSDAPKIPASDGHVCLTCEAELNYRRWSYDVA
ncbi:hypothetical protein K3A88_16080 [Streptomyces geysiriensis]|nr:hypothetical protein [Streptomyces geysiriensis]